MILYHLRGQLQTGEKRMNQFVIKICGCHLIVLVFGNLFKISFLSCITAEIASHGKFL